ncbi:MAG TPA: TetR/AcrR family transcriptional regulator [Acidisarcina sp.]|nr:TetR/AcrR family transcriptional regulator [Acidisarcina sp.]
MKSTLKNTEDAAQLSRGGEKYDRILEAAIEVVAEKGLQHARIADIAASAGVADGTVYLYFDNKNHILRAAIDSAFERFSLRVQTALATTHDPVEQLKTIARLHVETLVASRNLAIIVQTQVRQSAKFLEQFSHHSFVDYINLVREIVRAGQREGLIRPEISDRVAALCLFGALDEMISSWLFTGKPIDPEQTSTQVLDILLDGIRTTPSHA